MQTWNILTRTGFWLSLPVSALQGLQLRKSAIRLPEASGCKTGACGLGKPVHLLAIGDSIIAGVGTGSVTHSLPVHFAEALATWKQCSVRWRIDGTNGANIRHLRNRLRNQDQEQKTDVVLISIGVNDVTGLSTTRHWESELRRLIADLRNKWPEASVIFAGLPPMAKFPLPPQPLRFTLGQRAATLDAISAKLLADQPNMLHIPTGIDPGQHDFCEDGFHPSSNACRFWAEGLVQRLCSDTFAL
jgi:lysophospholipase L1-like esterase